MSFSTALALIALAAIGVSAWVVFWEYPRSAVEVTRNRLFDLRDQLFELGRSGEVPFNSPGYQFARVMLNGMIRYAHDITATQLLMSSLMTSRRSKTYMRALRVNWETACASLPKQSRGEVRRIIDQATDSLFQLVISRSVLLSVAFSAFLAVFFFLHVVNKAKTHVRERLTTTRIKEEAIEEILEHRPMTRIRPQIRAEASRYTPAEFNMSGLCPA